MTVVAFNTFGGIIPLLDGDKLPENAGQIAENVDLRSGSIRFWKRPSKVFTYVKVGTIQSIYRIYNGSTNYWCHWTDVVHAVRGPVNNLSDFKLYYTGDTTGQGWPKKTNLSLATGSSSYPDDYLEMGVPTPAATMTLSPPAGATPRTYVVTFVNTWGAEGPPSAAVTASGTTGTWTLNSIPTAPASPYSASAKWGISKRRIYRAFTDSAGSTNYYFVKEIADNSTTSTTEAVADTTLVTQGTLPTYEFGQVNSEWLPPPTNMKGLALGHNGIMAGYYDNVICFSEPYQPEAWPIRYQYKTQHKIVAVIPFGQSFIVATDGTPELFTGQHPRSMGRPKVNRPDMACVSTLSATPTPFGAMIATQNGYAILGNGEPEHLTDQLIGSRKWGDLYNPSTMMGAYWKDRLVMFYQGDSSKKGLIYDRQVKTLTSVGGVEVQCLFSDPVNNRLYVGLSDGVYEWDADSVNMMQGDYMTRIVTLPKPKNFAAYRIDGEFEVLGGDFAAEQAQIAIDAATNATTLALLPARSYPNPDRILMATGKPFPTGHYQKRLAGDSNTWAPGPNGCVMPTAGSLMVGGKYTTFSGRGMTLQYLAFNPNTGAMQLRKSKTMQTRDMKRLPTGYVSDKIAVRVSGNVPIHTIKLATNGRELQNV